jgi:hypothetical protein
VPATARRPACWSGNTSTPTGRTRRSPLDPRGRDPLHQPSRGSRGPTNLFAWRNTTFVRLKSAGSSAGTRTERTG